MEATIKVPENFEDEKETVFLGMGLDTWLRHQLASLVSHNLSPNRARPLKTCSRTLSLFLLLTLCFPISVVNFTNGQLLSTAKNKPKFSFYHKTKDRTKRRRVLVAETDHLTYVGTNYDPEALTGGSSGCR